jgi:hypothetical protein
MKPEKTTYLLVTEDGIASKCEVVLGCEADAFPKLSAHMGKFEAFKIDPSIIPKNDPFRDAWTFKGGKIGHDMAKAREIHRATIRRHRAELMAVLDIQFMRAVEEGADTKAIVAEKKRLRDAPADPRIEAAKTVDELRTVWPL